ncbi:hypothetical protein [Metallibacterium sp.]
MTSEEVEKEVEEVKEELQEVKEEIKEDVEEITEKIKEDLEEENEKIETSIEEHQSWLETLTRTQDQMMQLMREVQTEQRLTMEAIAGIISLSTPPQESPLLNEVDIPLIVSAPDASQNVMEESKTEEKSEHIEQKSKKEWI